MQPIARLLAPIGLVSYGIYLWHDTIVGLMIKHSSIAIRGGAAAWLLDAMIVFAVTMPIAAFSWFAIERPTMHWATSWIRRRTLVAVPPLVS